MKNTGTAKIILVCTDCDNTRILYHGIKDEIPISGIITEQLVSRKLLIKRRLKKLGWFKVAGQLMFQAGIVPVMRRLSKGKVKAILAERKLSIEPLPADKVTNVSSVNDPAFIIAVQQLNPDLIIVNGTRVISAKTLDHIKCPIINVHVGITPLYRGVHGAYWALAGNDAAHCGVTVHAIDKGIDTGGILAQDTITVNKNDNFITYPYLQFEKAIQLIKKVVPLVLSGNAPFLPAPQGKSTLWYHPTIWQYIRNRFKGTK
jgi:methionyl-tRNA formyltransferase